MIRLKADGRAARVKVTEPITTGSVGMPVVLDLSDDFDGLAVIACFEAGEAAADMAYFGDPLIVPSQCLGVVGVNLHVGVYGRDGEGNIVIPTVWADCGPIREGVLPSGVDPAQPEPDWTAQVQAAAQEAKDTAERLAEEVGEWSEAEDGRVAAEEARVTAETARADAETGRVAAEDVRVTAESARATAETARANAETDRDIAEADRIRAEVERIQNETQRKSAETARVTAESARATAESARVTEWASLKTDAVSATSAANAAATSASTAESDIRAAAERGDFDGISPSATVTQLADGATISITDKSGTTTASVGNGTDGTDGADGFSPTVDVQEITGGHEVTITDAQGVHSFDVMDGQGGSGDPDVAVKVDQLWGNQLRGEVTGDILTASDAYAAPPMALTVGGRSTQASTTGKNLFDKNQTPYGYYNGNTGAFVSNNDYRYWRIPVQEGDVIYLQATGAGLAALFYQGEYVGKGPQHGPYTVPSGVDEVAGNYTLAASATGIVTLNNSDLTYEPYTGGKPSPSPDYPQEIASVDEPSLELSTWNLYDLSATPTSEGWAVNGVQVTHTGANVSIFCGKANREVTPSERLEHCPVLPAGTYTFSVTHVSGDTAFYVYPINDSGKQGERLVFVAASYGSFTLNEATRIDIRFRNDGVESGIMLNAGSTALAYMPYRGPITTVPLYDGTLRSLPNGTKDTLSLSYLQPSTREGWAWYGRTLTALVGETTTAATDGVTGTVGVDVMSTTGEITDGPTVLYKLASAQVTDLGEIELPVLPAPTCTVWADPTTGLQMEYVRDTTIVIQQLEAAIADLATS